MLDYYAFILLITKERYSMMQRKNIILNNTLNMELLLKAGEKPDLDTTNEEPFWDDPHISQQMLHAHLNPDLDAASYNHGKIDQIVKWLVSHLELETGAKILDLGCGPGLYCTRFSGYGLEVTGMDYSKNSISYAKEDAKSKGLNIQYIYQNYLTMDYSCEFDAIFLIYCDLGALSENDRDLLLQKIYKALKPGGVFIFDAFTRVYLEQCEKKEWYVSESGFWRPYPHLVLEQVFHYEEDNVFLKRHIIVNGSGEICSYYLKDYYYSKESITQLLKKHRFLVQDIWSDLTGKAYEENTKELGVVAKKSRE
jgi:SAM-dependent methyltransferase